MVTDGRWYNTSGGGGDRADEEKLGPPSDHEVQTAAVKGTVAVLKRALGYTANTA